MNRRAIFTSAALKLNFAKSSGYFFVCCGARVRPRVDDCLRVMAPEALPISLRRLARRNPNGGCCTRVACGTGSARGSLATWMPPGNSWKAQLGTAMLGRPRNSAACMRTATE
jgi:hypothetical protein